VSLPKRIRPDVPDPDHRRPSWRQRLPWIPLGISLAVILSAASAVRPVRDAANLAETSLASLERPLGYVALAPLSAILDTITLLSVRQHVAFVIGLCLVFIAWRIWRHSLGTARWRAHAIALASLLGGLVITYAAAVFLPRPMAFLVATDPTVMRLDFHSHTSASGDARRSFTVERNRDWHRRAGYDAAFVTDHGTVAGAERAVADNGVGGLETTMLLQSIEATWNGEHVSILGAQRTYTGLFTPNLRDVDSTAVALASMVPTREPVVIWHHPRRLDRLHPAHGPGTAGIRAIEISNGAPDGMDKVRPQRGAIVALAQQANLALTTGSDNHGWGYVAPNWTLLLPSNWRGLRSDQLSLLIERAIREGGIGATRVVERVVADGADPIVLALSIVTVPARMFTTLSTDERVMWLVWVWLFYAATQLVRRRRAAA
jgi:hypothetical protein